MAEPTVAPLVTLALRYEHDVVLARQRARQIAELLGFDAQEQTRLATALSELARNAYEYGRDGRVMYAVEQCASGEFAFLIRVTDSGPGITDVQAILDGRYVSRTGMGLGLLGARRLAERFRIESAPGRGTLVEIARTLPPRALPFTPRTAARIAEVLASAAAQSPFEEVQRQNQELITALDEVRARQAEVERLNAELAETNRGVLALYAELDDRAQELRRASEAKSRFLSDMSHELRTPLTSVLNLTRMLLDRTDGELTPDQEQQVLLIRTSVESLTAMVNDLLDLAKIEAGRATLRCAEFTATAVFAALRGIMRPLLTNPRINLVFEDASELPPLVTDEDRLAQVLRNFLSNAIKFTEAGEIRVRATMLPGDLVRFSVTDSGIGISPADQRRIFEDYVQVDGPVQRRVRGTGLGLPLTRKLATLLGGHVELESVPGAGSTFSVVVPRLHPTGPTPDIAG